MTTARAILFGGCLIAAAILAHGWITRPSRYSFTVSNGVQRLDTRTGEIVQCERGVSASEMHRIFTCDTN
jgi:hypothetical protein